VPNWRNSPSPPASATAMKPPLKSFEPSAEALRIAREALDVVLASFDRKLEKLDPKELLPRYNRLRISLSCRAPHTERPVFLTVRRHGSKVGRENFYTVPFFPEPISVGEKSPTIYFRSIRSPCRSRASPSRCADRKITRSDVSLPSTSAERRALPRE